MEVERYLKQKCEDVTSDADRDIACFTPSDSGPNCIEASTCEQERTRVRLVL